MFIGMAAMVVDIGRENAEVTRNCSFLVSIIVTIWILCITPIGIGIGIGIALARRSAICR
jgi:hypothetical protein